MSETKHRLKVFLCHASQDKPIVRELSQCLVNEGWIDIWLDEISLLPGQDWRLTIEAAVDTADAVIVCLSSNSVNKDGFIQKEMRYVKEIALEKSEGSIFLIPLRLDECDVPRGLRVYQWADYFGEKKEVARDALLKSLRLRYEQKSLAAEMALQKEQSQTEKTSQEFTSDKSIQSDGMQAVVAKPPAATDDPASVRHQEKAYFIGSQLHQHVRLTNLIEEVFRSKNCTPYYADLNSGSPSVLLKVCQKIYLSDFVIFDISDPDVDTFIELGVALAFNKKIILTAFHESTIPHALKDCPVYLYEDYPELARHLETAYTGMCMPRLELADFCVYCNQRCTGFDVCPDHNICLILDKRGALSFVEWANVRSVIDPLIQGKNLTLVSLKENAGEKYLCNIRSKVKATHFSVCHFGELADETSLIALGMTIAYCRPWLLILREDDGEDFVPSCLATFDILRYRTLIDLSKSFESNLPDFLALFDPHAQVTSAISREPFWFVLSDWLATLKPATVTGSLRKGRLRIIRIGSDSFLDKFNITRRELIIGRDDASDIVIRSNLVTGRHASLYEQDGQYYLKDLGSKNGTFYNGRRISSGTIVPINPSGIIRIAHVVEFLIWDESPLPVDSFFAQNRHTTTAGYPHIVLHDEKPMMVDDESDFTFPLAFKGKINRPYQVQSYYHLGKILDELARRSNFSSEDYCITIGGVPLDEEETILDLKLAEGQVLEVGSFKEIVRKLLLKFYDVNDYPGHKKYVDFIAKRHVRGMEEVVFVYSAKSKLRADHLDGLTYESVMYMKTYWFRKLDSLSSDIYDLERKIDGIENDHFHMVRMKSAQSQEELRRFKRLVDQKRKDKSVVEEAIRLLDLDSKNWALPKKKQIVNNALGDLSGEISYPLINNIIVSTDRVLAPHHLKELAKEKGVNLLGLGKLSVLLDKAKETPIDLVLDEN